MNTTKRPALRISRRPAVPQDWVTEFLAEVQRDDLQIDVHEQSNSLYAGMEWLMETALAVYIVRPYLDAMLSELGKDHYNILKSASLKLYHRMGSIRVTRISTAGKVRVDPIYTLGFSIVVLTGEDLNLKFLIQSELSEAQAATAFEAFFALVKSLVEGTVTPETLEELEQVRVVGKTMLLAYDFDRGKILPVDPLARIEPH